MSVDELLFPGPLGQAQELFVRQQRVLYYSSRSHYSRAPASLSGFNTWKMRAIRPSSTQ